MAKTVKIYDLANNKISTIPAAELAPNMVEADVVGVGRVWISADEISLAGKIKHTPFNEEKRQMFRQLKSVLDEVYLKTIEAWEETFRKDSDPEQEIAIWLHIASTYQQSTAGKKLTLPQRKEYLMTILSCSRSPREHIFEIFQPKVISRQEAERVIELYHSK
jgi:hypothetical protein